MKKLMYSTWRWDRAVKVAFGMAESPAPFGARYKIESSKTWLDHGKHWRWHVYRVR